MKQTNKTVKEILEEGGRLGMVNVITGIALSKNPKRGSAARRHAAKAAAAAKVKV